MKRREFVPEKGYQSRRGTRNSLCMMKDTYSTEASAKAAASRVSKRDGTLVVHYECRFCDKFHLTKASNSKGDALILPEEFHGKKVMFDVTVPYISSPVTCNKCGGVEAGIQRLSVVDGKYTRPQGIILIEPNKMKHVKKGSKLWEHKFCPTPSSPEEPVTPIEDTDFTPEPEQPDQTLQLNFSKLDGNVVLDLYSILDPKNTVSDAFARGAAWLFVRQIVEEMSK